MYKVYQKEGNVKFFNNSYCPEDANRCERVRHYNLLFKKAVREVNFTPYVKKIHEAENALITNIRLLSMQQNLSGSKKGSGAAESNQQKKKGQNVKASSEKPTASTLEETASSQYINNFDAITLDLNFYKNTHYFFEIMRLANGHHYFLTQEMNLSKDPKRLEQSVFYQDSLNQGQSQSRSFQQKSGLRVAQEFPQKFFTLIPQIEQQDYNGITFGKCLLLIFEKAINAQYQDYLSRLDKAQHQCFFLTDPSTYLNIFVQDQRLSLYWASGRVTASLRDKVLKELDTIEKEMIASEHAPTTSSATTNVKKSIAEEDNEDENSDQKQTKNRLMLLFTNEQQSDQVISEDEEDRDIGYEAAMGSKYYSQRNAAAAKRTRGYASSQGQLVYREGSEDEEEDDPERYRVPKVRETTQVIDEEDDELDLEKQVMGKGAVGKLKALKNIRTNLQQVQKESVMKVNGKNVSLQEEEENEEYSDDFEKQSSEAENQGSEEEAKYFKDFGSNLAFKTIQVKEIIKPKQNSQIGTANPLISKNKYFFLKQDIQKQILGITSEHSSRDSVDLLAFTFIKCLSTFISLNTVYATSNQTGRALNFSQSELIFGPTNSPSTSLIDTSSAVPFKQRLYQYLVKLYEDSSWDDVLQTSESIPTAPAASLLTQNDKTKSLQYTMKQSGPKESTKQSNDAIKQTEGGSQQDQTQSSSNKNKSKKKREKKKIKNQQQAAAAGQNQEEKKQSNLDEKKEVDKKSNIDEATFKQIMQEQYNIEFIKEQMLRHQEPRSTAFERDLFRDSCTIQLPPASSISMGLGLQMSFPSESEDKLLKALSQKRHIEERTSLLTGQYQKDKYNYEYFLDSLDPSTSHYFDPTCVPDRVANYNQTNISTNHQNEDVEMADETAEQVTAPSDQKKKKRKKNKKNKKKKDVENKEEEEDVEIIELGDITTNIQDVVVPIQQQEEIKDAQHASKKINNFVTDEKSPEQTDSEGKLTFELTQEDKDFFEATRRLDEDIKEEIELFESNQLLTEEVASTLIQSTIEKLNLQRSDVQSMSESQSNKKNKKGKKFENINSATQQSGKSKKQQKKLARQQAKKAQNITSVQENPVIQKEETLIDEEIEEQIEEDDNINQQDLFEIEEEKKVEETELANQKSRIQSKKSVLFNEANTAPRQSFFGSISKGYASSSADDQDDNIKVPKRGSSSRGSSCTEDKIHQDTISMLGDLFPQQYKNPSPDTKLMISKITSSSSGSHSGAGIDSVEKQASLIGGSPDIIGSIAKGQRPNNSNQQKFIEQPYTETKTINNQNKKRNGKGSNGQQNKNTMSFNDQEAELRIKPRVAKKETIHQIQPPPKSQSVQPQINPEFSSLKNTIERDSRVTSNLGIPLNNQILDQPGQLTQDEDRKSSQSIDTVSAISTDHKVSFDQQDFLTNPDDKFIISQEQKKEITPSSQDLPLTTQSQHQQRQSKNKKKGLKQHQASTEQTTSVVKEMKERGAIARPSDIQNAAASKKKKHQPVAQQADQAAPVQAQGLNIQRSQTPNIEQTSGEGLLLGNVGGNKNNKQQKQSNQNGQKQGNQKQQNKKKGGNYQNNKVQNNQQQQQQQHQQLNAPAFEPLMGLNEQQNIQLQQAAMLAAAQQQINSGFNLFGLPQHPGVPNFFMNQGAFGLPLGLPAQQQNPFLAQQLLNQGATNPYFSSPDFQNYNQASFQTQNQFNDSNFENGAGLEQQLLIDRSSQQTQTDETRVKENGSQPSMVMNQFQNFNVQFNMPAQANAQPFPNLNPSMMTNNRVNQGQGGNMFFQPNFQHLNAPIFDMNTQALQQQILNQMIQQYNPALFQNLMGGLNDPSAFTGFPNMFGMNHQNLLFNPLLLNLQQSQQQPFFPGLHSTSMVPPTNIPSFQPSSQQQTFFPQTPLTPPPPSNLSHKSHSFTSQNKQHLQSHNLHNNYTNSNSFIQSMLTQITIESNRQRLHHDSSQLTHHHESSDINDPLGGQNVSHMTLEQWNLQQIRQKREEQFYMKMEQEVYKLKEKIKRKLEGIEGERQRAVKMIEQTVKLIFGNESPNARIQMYGSMATGLAIDSSDMDLLISGIFEKYNTPNPYNLSKQIDRTLLIEQMRIFYQVVDLTKSTEQEIELRNFLESSQIIETASIPVIKLIIDLSKIRTFDQQSTADASQLMEEDMRFLKVDITFNDSSNEVIDCYNSYIPPQIHMGLLCCDFIKQKLAQYPNLESLTLVLKKFLAIRNLNSPFFGGLNSYGLIILIIAYLNEDYEELYAPDGSFSAARTLKSFFYFFGKFDQSALFINGDQQIDRHLDFSPVLVIQDPLNPQNNIGKSTFNFDQIRAEFMRAYDKIEQIQQDFVTMAQETNESSEEGKQASAMWKKKLDIIGKVIHLEQHHD